MAHADVWTCDNCGGTAVAGELREWVFPQLTVGLNNRHGRGGPTYRADLCGTSCLLEWLGIQGAAIRLSAQIQNAQIQNAKP